jgi:hypothetical protein
MSIFLAICFDLFVTTLLIDQINCILNETSTIDKLKAKRDSYAEKHQNKKKQKWKNMCRVMTGSRNQGFALSWFIPSELKG